MLTATGYTPAPDRPIAHQQSGCTGAAFQEVNGLVIMEAESANRTGDWTRRTTLAGASGGAYYQWGNNNYYSDPTQGQLRYTIRINTPGTYRYQNRTYVGGDAGDLGNDLWLHFPEVADEDFYARDGNRIRYPRGARDGGGNQLQPIVAGGNNNLGFFKIFNNRTGEWGWQSTTNDNDSFSDVLVEFRTAGVYTMIISGRSERFSIDRFALYDINRSSPSEARDLSRGETRCSATAPPPADPPPSDPPPSDPPPSDNPTDPPVDNPGDTPVDNPGDTPGDNPGDTPVVAPVGPPAIPCANFAGETNEIVRAVIPAGAATFNGIVGDVYCDMLFDPVEIGVVDQQILHAVEVYGLGISAQNTVASIVGFTSDVQVCLAGTGSLLYRDASNSPRIVQPLAAFSTGGFTCGFIPNSGTVILVPGAAAPPGSTTGTTPVQSGGTYTVQLGDNLSRIAQRLGVPFNDLLAVNGLNPDVPIQPGQVLIIP